MKSEVIEVVKNVHELMSVHDLTLSVAESCTSGLISHYITSRSGASAFFAGGIVSYSEKIKKNVLGISDETIHNHGVVSMETAIEMAERVRLILKTDLSVSTTGNLGPDVLEGKEIGLIYIAASKEGKTVSRELRLQGDRSENKELAALAGLKLLIELVGGEGNG